MPDHPDQPDETHPDYDEFLPFWKVVRDTIAGSRMIKRELPNRDTTLVHHRFVYLPRLSGQPEHEYLAYQARALWVGYTARALRAWTGLLFRKPPRWSVGVGEEFLQADCDLQGRSLPGYIEMVGDDVASVGRGGTLVDWSDAEARPYFSYYATEAIINWRIERVLGRRTLTLLVLREEVPDDTDFVHETTTRWRVFRLEKGAVEMSLWQQISDQFVEVPATGFDRAGVSLTAIPFVFHSANEQVDPAMPVEPPLQAISEINISHYRTSADLEHGRHWAGIPTPWSAGFTDDTTKQLTLGTTRAWATQNTDAKVGFLEYHGTGLSELRLAITEKEHQMAMLGARAITPEVGGAEATETVKMRATAESASLQDMAGAMETQFRQLLRWFSFWLGSGTNAQPSEAEDAVELHLNRDFVSEKLTPQQITAWTSAFVLNRISFRTYFHNLQEGEAYPEGWTEEDELARLEAEAPLPVAPQVGEVPDPDEDD